MRMKWTALCLVVLLLYGSFCDAQRFQEIIGKSPYDHQQGKQIIEQPLQWTFPENPTFASEIVTQTEIRQPASATSVIVTCGDSIVQVIVQKDMFGIGQFVEPAHLTFGSCGFVTEDIANDGSSVIVFQSELHGCDSTLTMTQDSLIYRYDLKYNPQGAILRINKASVIVECHYPRIHNVSSLPLVPFWVPFAATKVSEEYLYFTLKLMTDDWLHQRSSHVYVLGTSIRIEASIMQFFHVPLRVFIDRCVVSFHSDPSSNPNYAFIENGCLVDGLTSASRFLNREVDDKLRFELAALMFQGYENEKLYITCYLKATSINHGINSEHRACSYNNGWYEASGVNEACNSCGGLGTGNSGWTIGVSSNPGSASGSANSGQPGVTISTGSGTYTPGHQSGTVSESGSVSVNYPNRQTTTVSESGSVSVNYPNRQTGTVSGSASVSVNYPNRQTGTVSETTSVSVNYPNRQTGTVSGSGSVSVNYPNRQTGPVSETTSVSVNYPNRQTGTVSGSGSVSVNYPNRQTGTVSETGSVSVTYPNRQTGTVSETGSVSVTYPNRQTGTVSQSGSGGVYYQPKQPSGGPGTVIYNPKQPVGTVANPGSAGGVQPINSYNPANRPGSGSQPPPPKNTYQGTYSGAQSGPVTVNFMPNPPVGTVTQSGSGSETYNPGLLSGTSSQSGSSSVTYFSKKLASATNKLQRARRDVPGKQSTVMEWESQVTLEIRVNRNTDA